MSVRGAGGGRVSIAGVVCYRPGDRPRLFYQLLVYRRRTGEPKGFSWQDYRDLIIATHRRWPRQAIRSLSGVSRSAPTIPVFPLDW